MTLKTKLSALRTDLPRVAALGLAVTLLAGCSRDVSPTGPTADPAIASSLIGSLTGTLTGTLTSTVSTLSRGYTVAPATASITLTSLQSGTVELRDAGLRIDIPQGAIPGTSPMTITVSAVAGDEMAYTFAPHGVRFNKPLVARQTIPSSLTSIITGLLAPKPQVAYFASPTQLSADGSKVSTTELLPTMLEVASNRVRFEIAHFSGYVIASGRKGD